jgi:two-component system chemotaxis response regulator CheY
MDKPLPKSVLIVDDEAHVRLYIRMLLKNMGVEHFIEGGNGKEGIELYREHRPDLALFDINMPVLDGLSALKEVMEEDPDACVIMMTAEATRQAVEESGGCGAVEFIRKDTPRAAIQEILEELFEEIYGEENAE